jgi:flavodoxin
MKALVIYDSFFGNTEKIAQAIGQALGAQGEVEVRRVSEVKAEQLAGVDVLVVGSPTRAFRPSPAISSFLAGIPEGGLRGVKVAAFDTGIPAQYAPSILRFFIKLFGYAAKPIADKLTKKGGELAAPPEGFFVKGSQGPLQEGELERAANWAKRILAAL